MRVDVLTLVTAGYARARAERDAEMGTTSTIEPTETTALFGTDSQLDSMGLVGLVLDVEEQLADNLGLEVTLMDEKALSRRRSPFRTIGSLTDYILELSGAPDETGQATAVEID